MNSQILNPAGLAAVITLEGKWESVARRHTCLLCWNDGESPVIQIENNGTCCLVITRSQRMLVTCAHVWNGFQDYRRVHPMAKLWISLATDSPPLNPSFPFLLSNPHLIDIDDNLDLATITFDEIDSLEAQRFFYFRPNAKSVAKHGDIVHFVGFAGEAVRQGNPSWTLNYCYSSRTIYDVSKTKFILHGKAGTIHHQDKNGKPDRPYRAGGESGAPVFRVKENFELELAGFVSQLCSSGLGSGETTAYEMSDGDVFVTHSCFIQHDGLIVSP